MIAIIINNSKVEYTFKTETGIEKQIEQMTKFNY